MNKLRIFRYVTYFRNSAKTIPCWSGVAGARSAASTCCSASGAPTTCCVTPGATWGPALHDNNIIEKRQLSRPILYLTGKERRSKIR